MSVPNGKHIVESLASQFPDEWRKAHNPSGGGPETEAFIRRLAWVLHSTLDPRFGLCGKRGSPNDISDDAITFRGVSLLGDVDPTNGREPITVFDVIGGAGGPNPTVQWNAAGPATPQPHAAWVQPEPVGESAPAPVLGDVWTAQHDTIRQRMAGRSTQNIAEQLAHSFPSESWGQKRAGEGRGISADTIARKMPDGSLYGVRVVGAFHVWGTLGREQVFVPVAAINHLGDVVAPPPPSVDQWVPIPPGEPIPPPAPAVDYGPRFDELAAAVASLAVQVATLQTTAGELLATVAALKGQEFDIDWRKGTIRPRP